LRDLDFLWEMNIKLRELQTSVSKHMNDGVSNKERPFFKHLGATLKQVDADIIAKIREKAQPEAPYSALVRVWIKARLEE